MLNTNDTYFGDALEILQSFPNAWVNCIVTSPPYWGLRDYEHPLQVGMEKTPSEYIERLSKIFLEARRVLKDDGTLWLVIGDSYVGGKGQSGNSGSGYQEDRRQRGESLNAGYQTVGGKKRTKPTDDRKMMKKERLKSKDLIGIPWRLALALQQDGWYLRQDIIWHKPNPMPESVRDRCTSSHEYIFLFSKSQQYYYNQDAIREPHKYDGRKDTTFKGAVKLKDDTHTMHEKGMDRWKNPLGKNKRSVWTVPVKSYPEAHFAVYPEELIEPCILAGCPEDGTVLDPFMGSGTTAQVAMMNGRNSIGIELNESYGDLISNRIKNIKHTLTARDKIKKWFKIER